MSHPPPSRFAKRALACLAGFSALAAASSTWAASVQADRSLFVTEVEAIKQVTLQDVAAKLLADAGDSRSANDYLADLPFNLGSGQFSTLANMQTIAITNRFDLASANGSDCGEYRIAFNGASAFARGEATFLIFEARMPNPNPAKGIEGCRPIAQFWADLSAQPDATLRGQALKQFYLEGINGWPAVVSLNHYQGKENNSGQIRRNSRGTFAFQWTFSEFKTLAATGGSLNIEPATIKDVPSPLLAQDGTNNPDATSFQNAVLAGLGSQGNQLLANSMSFLSYELPLHLNTQSDSTGRDGTIDSNRLFDITNFNPSGAFAAAIQNRLNTTGSQLTPSQVINRVNALTCVGCHAQAQDLGAPLVFDTNQQNREFLSVSKEAATTSPPRAH